MLRGFHRMRSFGDKVTWLVTSTSAVAIVAVSFALATANHFNLQQGTFDSLKAQSAIVALNSGAPLVFGDRTTANEVLAAFQTMPSVTSATLYALDGQPFAHYRRDPGGIDEAGPLPLGFTPSGGHVVSVTAVQEKGQPLGRLQVVYDLSDLRRQLWESLALAILVSLAAMTLVFLVARRMTGVLIAPIAGLSRAAREVSETRDYSLRARKTSADEVGAFTDTFNEMLAQIQRQDTDLKASREEAEIASRMKDEFLATLSHELRTPMTPILGWAQILHRVALDNPQVRQAAEVIERNALAQTRIIDDLLDMSRIISGKIRLDVQAFMLRDVVSGALEAVRGAAEARGVLLETAIDGDVPSMRGDPHRIQQVLWNLLSNAIKFTGDGGRVRVSAQRAEAAVEITVSDSGQGITPEFLPHVFERFRQADSSATRHHGGLGLGLAIVKQIVEMHGGSIAVASEGPGRGATFTVVLPNRRGETIEAVAPIRPGTGTMPTRADDVAAPSLLGLRILVVDDEADARDWIARVLADAGAEICVAESAAEAVERLPSFLPDVLLSDIGMPGTDGYALIRQVRSLPSTMGGTVPGIALTAFARVDDRTRALAAGYQLHLGKPVDEEELIAAINSVAGPGPQL